jgi:thiosulfate/3-mercaptopyruvate sulfurtransferase
MSNGYANPDVLVSTDWVADNLDAPNTRILESNEDVLLYDTGHIPGALKIDWLQDLQDPTIRDFIDADGFNALMSRLGIERDTHVIFYGDRNNWWAAYAYWFFKYMGHDNCAIMNGGRMKWVAEQRPLTRDVPQVESTSYTGASPRPELRAFQPEVMDHIGYDGLKKVRDNKPLVDVRSPGEYSGELLHMPDFPQEGAQRGGHIPGAQNIPWATAANEDGTFKGADDLKSTYQGKGVVPDEEIVTYCRIGERSAHTWFVLHELLGYPNVRNYDGSWTEWGNMLRVPIER